MSDCAVVELSFETGEDLLRDYWGYLSGGGLIIGDPGMDVGENILLRVAIESTEATLHLQGKVVKREPDTLKAIIAFRSGEAHDMLLNEAMADSEDVAPRRYVRHEINQPIQSSVAGSACEVTLINLSQEGCCLQIGEGLGAQFSVGLEVTLIAGGVHALGRVVWSRNLDRGLRMATDEARPLLKHLCGELS